MSSEFGLIKIETNQIIGGYNESIGNISLISVEILPIDVINQMTSFLDENNIIIFPDLLHDLIPVHYKVYFEDSKISLIKDLFNIVDGEYYSNFEKNLVQIVYDYMNYKKYLDIIENTLKKDENYIEFVQYQEESVGLDENGFWYKEKHEYDKISDLLEQYYTYEFNREKFYDVIDYIDCLLGTLGLSELEFQMEEGEYYDKNILCLVKEYLQSKDYVILKKKNGSKVQVFFKCIDCSPRFEFDFEDDGDYELVKEMLDESDFRTLSNIIQERNLNKIYIFNYNDLETKS